MVADVEVSWGAWGRWWGKVTSDFELDAQHCIGVGDDAFREGEVDVDAHYAEDEGEWEPKIGDDGVEWVRALDKAAVVEDDRVFEAVSWDRTS